MARRPQRSDAALPIEVERGSASVPGPTAVVELKLPGEDVAQRLLESTRRAQRAYAARFGMHRGHDPRRQSVVSHRVAGRADAVADRLRRVPRLRWSAPGLDLTVDAAPPTYDAVDHELRLPGRLHLAWSWPDLPVWLAVGELGAERCTLRLSLRSHRRWRYPARYFDAAHAALTGVEASLAAPPAG